MYTLITGNLKKLNKREKILTQSSILIQLSRM